MPAGALSVSAAGLESRGRPASVRTSASRIRSGYLWDPLRRLEQVPAIEQAARRPGSWWLSDVYHRASSDATSAMEQIERASRPWGANRSERST